MLVQHHVKYKEIHGHDEIVMMEWGAHRALHMRLRKSGECNIPAAELHRISVMANNRTKKSVIDRAAYSKNNISSYVVSETMMPFVRYHEQISYNLRTGNVCCTFRLRAYGGKKLFYIDI